MRYFYKYGLALGMVLTILGSSLGAADAFEPDVLKHCKAPDWRSRQVSVPIAMSKIAHDTEGVSPRPIIVMEGWTEDWAAGVFKEGMAPFAGQTIAMNPFQPLFDVNTQGMNMTKFMDLVASESRVMEWHHDAISNVYVLTRKGLREEARWPLNQPLGKQARQTMTYEQAASLADKLLFPHGNPLEKSRSFKTAYQSSPNAGDNLTTGHALRISRRDFTAIKDKTAWRGTDKPGATARDLAFALMRAQADNTSSVRQMWWRIEFTPMPNALTAAAELKKRPTLEPSFNLGKALDEEQARKELALIHAGIESAKRKVIFTTK